MRSLTHSLRYFSLKSAEMQRNKLQQFIRRSQLRSFICFSLSGEMENEKKSTLSTVEDSLRSIYEHKIFYGGRNKVHQIDDEARLCRGSTVKTKHQRLTSVAWDVGRTLDEIVNYSPAARDLHILFLFNQHPPLIYQPTTHRNLWSII